MDRVTCIRLSYREKFVAITQIEILASTLVLLTWQGLFQNPLDARIYRLRNASACLVG